MTCEPPGVLRWGVASLRSVVFVPFALVVALGCEARVLPPLGCTRTSECPEPEVCNDGECGSECNTARDCGSNRRCVRVGEIGRCLIETIRQCDETTPCELDGLVCREERCYNGCDACTTDTVCVDGICVLVSDAGA